MTKSFRGFALAACLGFCLRASGQDLLLYMPFDGRVEAALSQGSPIPKSVSDAIAFTPGLRGLCARIDSDCRLSTPGNFRREAGTVAFWLRPPWDGRDQTGRTLFCLYGHRTLKLSWMKNRWSIVAGRGQLGLSVYGADSGQRVSLSSSIATWQRGQWHHVAMTWRNFNSGRADAEFGLYLDGERVGAKKGLRIEVGPVSDTLDIGRDSDASPDYAQADFDELHIYGQALSPEEIRQAVALVRAVTSEPVLPARKGSWRPEWWNDAWRFRCRVEVPASGAASDAAARLPFDLQSDIAGLGVRGAVDPASVRIVWCDPNTGECAKTARPVPMLLEDNAAVWRAPAASGAPIKAHVYFGLIECDTATPLFVRSIRRLWPAAPKAGKVPAPDYASDTYGDAWDFDDGDFEGIDQWGNKPWCLKNRKVDNGVLSFDVSEDPWFIWGNMWSQVQGTHRPVAIDLDKYPVLKMRVRQSCPSAEWQIFGRAGSPALRTHKFTVKGQGWQVVRIDLRKDARWRGVLDAFRIDPTAHVKEAHVEIDWVRLTLELEARRARVETLGSPSGQPARLMTMAPRTTVTAGQTQTVQVLASDAQHREVAGLPVTLRLKTRHDGRLECSPKSRTLGLGPRARRGITNDQGRIEAVLVSSRRAGEAADVLEASVDFSTLRSPEVTIRVRPGPAHHYRVSPTRPVTLRERQFPLTVQVQIVDEHDNALGIAGRRVALTAPPGARLEPTSVTTGADGRAQAALRVDVAKRWVYRVEAQGQDGLTGRSAQFSVALDQPRPDPIRLLPNGYFAHADGRPFVPLGGFYANWVQSETPDGEWAKLNSFTDTTDDDKRRWMRFLHESGVTALRFMLRTHRPGGMEPMDVGGCVNQALFADALRYMDLARETGLRFQLVVHEDYTKPMYYNEKALRGFALPQFAGEDLDALRPAQRRFIRDQRLLIDIAEKYTDPDAMACQDLYARELVAALRNNPQVFAYELENEMVSCPASWANHAIEVIRSADPAALVCASHGGGGLHTADPLWWHRNVRMDFYNYHLYPHGRQTTPEIDYGAAVDVLTRYGQMCGVSCMGESAGDQFRLHPSVETRRWVMRDIIWMGLTSGNPGVFFWNARGSEVREFKMARDAMAQLDLATFRRAKPEIGIDVRHGLDHDKFFRSPAGANAYAMMGRYSQHYLSQGVDFDFTFEPERYEQHCDLSQFAPPAAKHRRLRVPKGWQCKYLARQDWSEALVYVRNLAGIEPWDSKMGRRGAWRQYLRQRARRSLLLELDLPAGRYLVHAYDLDAQTVAKCEVRGNEAITLGTTDHDFALVVKRSAQP